MKPTVQTLAACIHFASPLLIADYVCWGSISPDENPPFPNEVETVFRLIEEVARLEFPKEVGTVVSQYIDINRIPESRETLPSIMIGP